MAKQDEATHGSGKRDAERASSDAHETTHSRDQGPGKSGADPQRLDIAEAQAKRRAMERKPAEG